MCLPLSIYTHTNLFLSQDDLEHQNRILLRIVVDNHNRYTSAIERPSLILYCTPSHIQKQVQASH